MQKHRCAILGTIYYSLGITLATLQIILCIVCAAAGCAAALGLDKFGTNVKNRNNIE